MSRSHTCIWIKIREMSVGKSLKSSIRHAGEIKQNKKIKLKKIHQKFPNISTLKAHCWEIKSLKVLQPWRKSEMYPSIRLLIRTKMNLVNRKEVFHRQKHTIMLKEASGWTQSLTTRLKMIRLNRRATDMDVAHT